MYGATGLVGVVVVISDLFLNGLCWPQIVVVAASAAFDFNAAAYGLWIGFEQQSITFAAMDRFHLCDSHNPSFRSSLFSSKNPLNE